MKRPFVILFGCLAISHVAAQPLTQTKLLKMEGDLSAHMVAGIDKFLMREIKNSVKNRAEFWSRNHSSVAAYDKSVEKNRDQFRFFIGAVDKRLPITELEYKSTTSTKAILYEDELLSIHAIRWAVFPGVHGEGLLLKPKTRIIARVVAIPDADQTPEQLVGLLPGTPIQAQFARRLAEAGCQVVVPVLIDRNDEWAGDSRVVFTNQPHREWIYRQAFQMGRHIIGYEVQKILSIVDWFSSQNTQSKNPSPIGVAGYGEGGLLALYSGALDIRISATLVSGYFNSRQRVWEEPIYRNVFGLLEQFGDAEIATLIGPRGLVAEHSPVQPVAGPPKTRPGRRGGAAPGMIKTIPINSVVTEFSRARSLAGKSAGPWELIRSDSAGSDNALKKFALSLRTLKTQFSKPRDLRFTLKTDNTAKRQQRQIKELTDYTQQLLRFSEYERSEYFWKKLPPKQVDKWEEQCEPHRKRMWQKVIGQLPAANIPVNPRSRKILETEKWTGYDVLIDVWPDVYAWGIFLLPKDLKPGEKRPVVVCQHGLEGVPMDTVTRDTKARAFQYYSGFSSELADRGFIVFAPHNPYRGRDLFRVLQRKANPLGKTLFSVIIGQHNRVIDWLETLPYVDSKRIGFYGLSYGGKTAMRVPALIDRYSLSICSADFNEWIKKNTTVDSSYSYMFTGEYEIFEYNLGHTFNYAEMGALIAPRPFMVERGHRDGVAPDEWVAYEYAKIRRLYGFLGIPERTEIEFFNGPHKINGEGTYKFLHRHLNWPLPK